jgi:hypothetical protein
MDRTECVELLIGLPHRSRSYAQPLAHGLDVIGDWQLFACSLLPREALCLSGEQVNGDGAHDERRVWGGEDAPDEIEQSAHLQASLKQFIRGQLDQLFG